MNKINWIFTDLKQATKLIDIIPATSFDKINFFISEYKLERYKEKKIDSRNYCNLIYDYAANQKAKKDIEEFLKNDDLQGKKFIQFIKN